MNMTVEPFFEQLYDRTLKNTDSFMPEYSSETWEVLTHLKRKAQKRRWRRWLTGSAIALSFIAGFVVCVQVINRRTN